MRDDVRVVLGHPAQSYDANTLRRAFREVELFVTRLTAKGPITVSDLMADTISVSTSTSDTSLVIKNFSGDPQPAPGGGANYVPLHVAGEGTNTPRIVFENYADSVGGNNLTFRKARGTVAAPTAVTTNDQIINIAAFGYGSTAYSAGTRGGLLVNATQTWTDAAHGTQTVLQSTPTGTIVPVNSLILAGNAATFSGSVSAGTLAIRTNIVTTTTDISLTDNANVAAGGDMNFYIDSDNNTTNAQFNWRKDAAFQSGHTDLMTLAENGDLILSVGSDNIAMRANNAGQQIQINRLSSGLNSNIAYTNTSGSIYAGHGPANTFAIGSSNNLTLTANQWMTLTSQALTGPNSIYSVGGTPTLHTRDTNGTGATATGWVAFEDSTTARMGYVGFGSTSNTAMTLFNDLGGDINLNPNGGVVNIVGGQLKFPATQVPSTDANTLDDYAENVFTPTVTFTTPGDLSVSYVRQNGWYRKIGSTVTVGIDLSFTPTFTTASGEFRVASLPFTSGSTADANLRAGGGTIHLISSTFTWPASATMIAAVVSRSSSQVQIRGLGSGITSAFFSASNLTSGGSHLLQMTITYITAN